jgi:tRNA (guanine6-N2)-methyltransferase
MRNTAGPLYILHTLPGFDAIVREELKQLPEPATILEQVVHAGRNGMSVVAYDGHVSDLLELRTVDDVFLLVHKFTDLPPKYSALKIVRDRLLGLPAVGTAVRMVRGLYPKRGGEGKMRFRVIARQQGEAPYRRVDLQEAVGKGIGQRDDFRWRLAEDGMEFWVTQHDSTVYVALRISDETMRHRTYKINHIEASLRPTAAAAMVLLTKPKPNDVFLDPMCGAGTTLIERALMMRYDQLIGGDLSPDAVEQARANIGNKYKPIEIHEWDARSLPIDEASVNAVTVNLPFGVQISTPEENRRLYPAVMKELKRVMVIGARAVLLTSDMRAINRSLERTSGMYIDQQHQVVVLGRRAQLIVVQKR